MIIDMHAHVFPGEIRLSRGNYFSGEPEFKLLYESMKSKLVGVGDVVEMMEEEGVDRTVVFGFPWHNDESMRKNNDYVIESVKRYPDKLIGFSCVDVLKKNAAKEVQRCLDAGLAGVGELAFYQSGINRSCLKGLAPVMELCKERNVPVMIHTNEPVGHNYPGKSSNTLAQIYQMVKQFPDNKIILAHWGGGIFLYHLLKKEVRDVFQNVWYDTAASPFLYNIDVYQYAVKLGLINRVLLGTDFPLIRPGRYFKELSDSGLDEKALAAVMGENASELLAIS